MRNRFSTLSPFHYQHMEPNNKVIIIGVDSLDWNILQVFIDRGLLPTFARLIETGSSGAFLSRHQQYRSAACTSMMTGVEPILHGVLHDMEYGPGGLSARSVTAESIRVPRVWELAAASDIAANVMAWPALVKSKPIKGIQVMNGIQSLDAAAVDVWPLSPESVMPLSWRENVLDYRVFPDDIPQQYLDQLLQYLPPLQREPLHIPCKLLFSQLLSLHSVGMRLAEDNEYPWRLLALRFDTFAFLSELPLQVSFEGNVLSYLLGWYQFLDNMLAQYSSYLTSDDYLMIVSEQGVNPAVIGKPTGLSNPAGAGVLCIKGPDIPADHLLDAASVMDIAPTILTMLGLDVPTYMAGRVLFECQAERQPCQCPDLPQPLTSIDLEPPSDSLFYCQSQLQALGYPPADFTALQQITTTLYAEHLFVLAQHYYQQAEYVAAIDCAQQSLSQRPHVIPVIILLCRALMSAGKLTECHALIQQYQDVDIGPVWRDVVDGMYAFGVGDFTTAALAFERLATHGDGPINAPLWCAECMIRLGKLDQARSQLEVAVTWSIEQSESWSRLAHVYRLLNMQSPSLAAIHKAVALQPSNASLLITRFELLAGLGQFAAAKADLLRAIQLDADVISEKEANAVLMNAYHQHAPHQVFELVKF